MAEIFIKFLFQQDRDENIFWKIINHATLINGRYQTQKRKKSRLDEIFIMRTNNKS
jgi:hypothetical protein